MSLITLLNSAFTDVATAIKADRASMGPLTNLTTTAKDSLVNAINEVKASIASAGAGAAINDSAPSTTSVYSSSKTEAFADAAATAAAVALINDTTSGSSSVYSSSKTDTNIAAAVAALVASSPSALDTLNELASALGDDANFSATMAAALGNRVRFDAAQSLTSPQQAQAQSNISVYSQAQIGDPTTDFSATFAAALT